jgi:hypothetical protein
MMSAKMIMKTTMMISRTVAIVAMVLAVGSAFLVSATPKSSVAGLLEEAEVRNTVLRIFNQLKGGEYSALYDSLPSSTRTRMSRERFVAALERSREAYRLDSIEIGAVRIVGDLAAVDTVMYGHIAKPIEGDGKLVVQQYLVKENGSWRVATGDRATIDRFLKSNPGFARRFPIKRTRAFIKNDGKWVEVPFGARPR